MRLQCCCQYPGCPMPGFRARQATAYSDEESNWVTLCDMHHEENDQYWEERWEEYYSGLGVFGI